MPRVCFEELRVPGISFIVIIIILIMCDCTEYKREKKTKIATDSYK